MEVFTDPETGRPYAFDPITGRSRWLDQPAPPSMQVTQELPVVRHAPVRQPDVRRGAEWGGSEAGQGGSEAGRGGRLAGRGGRVARMLGVAAVVAVLLGALLVFVTRGFGDQDGPGSSAAGGSAPSGDSAPREPGVGDAVRDGKFEFTVTGTRTARRLGNDWINTSTDGTFYLVSVTVRNVSDEGKTFISLAQKLRDAEGREYTADPRATLYLWQVSNLVDRIDPGGTVRGTIVFDIPAGAAPERVELHDSLLSDGVGVRLPGR
jgi:hypothetical protein